MTSKKRTGPHCPCLTLNHGMLTHTSHCSVTVSGAAQTLALYRSLLSSHRSQNCWGSEQCLTHTRTHSHQPEQVHGVRPVSYGEDRVGEAQRGARSSDGLNLPAPLLLSPHIPVCCWEVNIYLSVDPASLQFAWSHRFCFLSFVLADHFRIHSIF